jgi:hypothetical protein
MSSALVPTSTNVQARPESPAPIVPWRDPHTVQAGELQAYIGYLKKACLQNPESADLRTWLGMAHAVNYDVPASMAALESAVSIDPTHFWAQLKYAELHYRLRALIRAEEETLKAVDLAQNAWQLAAARKQLQEIRKLNPPGTGNVTRDTPRMIPALVLSAMALAALVVMMWK